MKRKFFALIFGLLFALSAFAFAGCDGGRSDNGENGGDGGKNPPVDSTLANFIGFATDEYDSAAVKDGDSIAISNKSGKGGYAVSWSDQTFDVSDFSLEFRIDMPKVGGAGGKLGDWIGIALTNKGDSWYDKQLAYFFVIRPNKNPDGTSAGTAMVNILTVIYGVAENPDFMVENVPFRCDGTETNLLEFKQVGDSSLVKLNGVNILKQDADQDFGMVDSALKKNDSAKQKPMAYLQFAATCGNNKKNAASDGDDLKFIVDKINGRTAAAHLGA